MVNGLLQWGGKSGEQAAEESAAATPAKAGKKKDKKGAKEAAVTANGEDAPLSASRLLILRAMIESVLHRSAAFSTVLLSEAVRLLSPSTCALLLRVFAYTLRGLTSLVNDDGVSTVHLSAGLGDEQIKRAISWMEALLDGHFSATALQASVHAPTRRALTSAMEAVSNAETAAEEVESAMGLWTHITRVIHHGSEQTKPIAGLYQMEQLSF